MPCSSATLLRLVVIVVITFAAQQLDQTDQLRALDFSDVIKVPDSQS